MDTLAPHLAGWDALAVARTRPFCAPAWMLAWWRCARPVGARLSVVFVYEHHDLLAVAPFFANPTFGLIELRLLGAGFSHRIGVLARAGAETRVASVLTQTLAATRPASVVFEGVEREDPWPDLMADSWPSRRAPARRLDGELEAPTIRLDGDYESWLDRRERRYRKEMRRLGRRLDEQGVAPRIACDEQAIDVLLRLHHELWATRGGSNVNDSARAVLIDAAAAMADSGRLLVTMLDSPAGPVSAELVVRAGNAAVFWGGGFDPAWSQYGPGMQTMLAALRLLAESGTVTADLGGGSHEYKRRMADEITVLSWRTLFPHGWRHPLIRLRLAPKHLRLGARKAARFLPAGWQSRLRAIFGRRG